MSEQFEKIGQRIRTRRKALKMNQAELAELLGISNNHMSSIENGKHSTKLETFLKLCECLKTTPNHLLLGCMQCHLFSIKLKICYFSKRYGMIVNAR